MNESLLARRYAKALLAYSQELGEAEALYPIMKHLGQRLRPQSHERDVIGNPVIAEELREEFVVALAGNEAPTSLERFVKLVFDHNRESLLGEMARSFVRLYRTARGITYARLESAHPLDEHTREKIVALIVAHCGGEVELDTSVSESLIGGFVLRVDGRQLDGSVAGRLERIRRHFAEKNRSIV